MKPLIGITAYSRTWEGYGWPYHVCYALNAHAIEKAGGLPVLIPEDVSEENLRAIYQRLDGVLLPGGGDIAPEIYQAQRHTKLYGVDEQRDAMEIALTQWAVEDDLPIFGICRGIQVMNVALGGTLIQDIPDCVQTDLRHSSGLELARNTILHNVRVDSGTKLAAILGDTDVPVNSIHHQALEQVADVFRITAHADDGLVEGLEIPQKRFALAVQWHPRRPCRER